MDMKAELIFCAQLFFVEILRKMRGNPIKKCDFVKFMIFVCGDHCGYWNRAQHRPSYVIVKGDYGQSKHAARVDGIKSTKC
jgi:hypothetical protein